MKRRRNIKAERIIIVCLLGVITFLILAPVVWFFLLSVKEQKIAFVTPPRLFFPPTHKAYQATFFSEGALFPWYLWNSFVVAGSNTLLCLLFGLPTAYGFARYRFRARRQALTWILVVRMFPPITMIIPLYLVMYRLRLLDTYLSLVLAYLIYNLPFVVWTMKGFFHDIPRDLDEAAMVDGCSPFGAFLKIALPLAGPGVVVTSMLNFILSWNEFMWASILTSVKAKTMTVAIAGFWTNVMLDWAKIGATSTVFIIPPFVVSILLRKYIVRGLTMGAVKM